MGIYVNQVGYLSNYKKRAVITENGEYGLFDATNDKLVFKDEAALDGYDQASGENICIFDFDQITTPGKYYIQKIGNTDIKSVSFVIADDVYDDLNLALIKALYFQRCGCALDAKYAGVYTHAACHTGDSITLEDYMNKVSNPKKYALQGGWHDAGDYGRYSTAAAVALGHLLYAFEMFPESFKRDMNIPETGNGIPDILNECRYELDWLIQMQNEEGGVYHKLTAFCHAPFIMPEEDKDQFLIYPVSSIAVADYVAIMCVASRVYRPYDTEFADKALSAARLSFKWLQSHDYIGFHNPEGSNTGEYDDDTDVDERLWAAAELVRTDKDGDTDAYMDMLKKYVYSDIPKTDFGWTDVSGFSLLALLTDKEKTAGDEIIAILKKALFAESDRLLAVAHSSGYELGMEPEDYVWGSNMVVCNRGMLLILAAMMTEDEGRRKNYTEISLAHLHYLLGRNAVDRSYVTGFGEKAYRNPHNRPTAADGIDDPMPGWVSGGPFKKPVDEAAIKIIPAGTAPMKCHADDIGSYSTNEITIYWNSPAAFMTAYYMTLR